MKLTQQMIEKLRNWELRGRSIFVGQTVDATKPREIRASSQLVLGMDVNTVWISWYPENMGMQVAVEDWDKDFCQLLLLHDREECMRRIEEIDRQLNIKGVA